MALGEVIMKYAVILLALTTGLAGAPQSLLAQTAAPKAMALCPGLAFQWDNIEKDLAEREAEGFTDNSAPRATLREMKNANDLTKAQLLFAMMQAGRCPLPDTPPNYIVYFSDALKCGTARLRGTKDAPECDRKTWKKLGSP